MKKYFILLLLLIFVIVISSNFVDSSSILEYRIEGAIITVFFVLVIWICLWKDLFKSEPKVKNECMSLNYLDMSNKQLKNYLIDSEKFKEMAFGKFKGILEAISNGNKEFLKDNLSIDLYNYYSDEMENKKNIKISHVIKDIELIDIKIYDVIDEYNVLTVCIYINVKMYDYYLDDLMKLIEDKSDVIKNYEFEINFIKNKIVDGDFVISKKNCVNVMEVMKKDN